MAVGCILAAAVLPVLVAAQEILVPPGSHILQAAIDAAEPGTILVLQSGIYNGRVSIDKSLILQGEEDSIIDGGGEGRVITVNAPDVEIRGMTIKNSGDSLATEDSGIFVTGQGKNALIEFNRLEGNLIGVYLKGAADARVRKNTIYGSRDPHMNDRGNGVQIWNSPGAVVEDNRMRYGRDGIFVTTSKRNIFRNNHFQDMRFAIHYMYTNHSRIENNRSTGNHMGYAIMFSADLKIYDNVSIDDRDKGFFLNFTNDSDIAGNDVNGGPEKCLFIYNSHFNSIQRNRFRGCDIGVHFTAGSEDNIIFRNSFDGNRMQVKYVGTRLLEWSKDGVGNYWSDHVAFDRNRDGIADNHYQPNNLVDQIVWRNPSAKVLLNSPALQLLHWAQSQFPALHPGGVVDSAPLMQSQWESQP
jgi:nitrous oxidase accessory protein